MENEKCFEIIKELAETMTLLNNFLMELNLFNAVEFSDTGLENHIEKINQLINDYKK